MRVAPNSVFAGLNAEAKCGVIEGVMCRLSAKQV